MSFLNPALLAFSAAVAVPIIIHLLNRRRFRRIPWAAMRFIRLSLEKNRRRTQWEDILLLALRCLVVALLALALARPALRTAAGLLESNRASAVILLDISASLAASDGAGTRFEIARTAAEAVVDAYPVGSSLSVLLTGDRTEEPIAEPTYDLNLVRKTLREASLSELGTDHAVGIARAAEILRDQTSLRKEIVLVTDRQAWGWRRLPDLADIIGVGKDIRLRVVLVGEPLEDNLAISTLTRSSGFVSTREPARFYAEIINRGAGPVRQVRATIHVDNGPAVDEATLDSLAAGESRRLTFFARLPTEGFHAVSVRVPADRLTADDDRTAVVRVVETVHVLVVDGHPESNAAFFLRNALQPVSAEAASEYYLQPRVVPPGQVALIRLSDYDAVIMADVPSLTDPALAALTKYVREGGALLCFPGPKTQPAYYNGELLERAGLLPASLGVVKGSPETEDGVFRLEAGPYDDPLFGLWNESGAGSLTSAHFRAAWELVPAAARTNAVGEIVGGRVMIRFSDGSPAMVERNSGRGRVLLFASTAGTEWNDLAIRPAFVPFLHRAVASLAEAQEARFNITAGSRISLRMPSELTGRDVVVTTPGSPGHRLTRTVRSGPDGALIDFDDTDRAGPYRVTLTDESAPLSVFAAQLDPRESDLTELSAQTRKELERWAHVVDWTTGPELHAAFDRERSGAELWLPLAVSVLLLGMTETWLAQHFSRPK